MYTLGCTHNINHVITYAAMILVGTTGIRGDTGYEFKVSPARYKYYYYYVWNVLRLVLLLHFISDHPHYNLQ